MNSDSKGKGSVDRKVVVPLGAEEVHEAVDLGVEGRLFGEVIGEGLHQAHCVFTEGVVVGAGSDSEGEFSHEDGIC